MDEKRNQQQQAGQSEEQNPTLQQPGSQVADYGNPTGGSGDDTQQSGNSQDQQSSRGTGGGNDTIGNP